MTRVLVTGAAGFIGSHIVDEALSRGYKVYGVDNFTTGVKSNINPGCDFIQGDIRNFDFHFLGKLDGIFHTAALARIQPSFIDPIEYQSVNLTGTLKLIRHALEIGSKIIFSSSSSVYGVKGKLPFPMDENYPLNPSSPYALQKRFCEQYLDMYRKFNKLRYIALRYFNVYGPRQIPDGPYAAVVGIFLNQFRNKQNFTIYGDGLQRRDFTFVKDVANANLMSFESDVEGEIFNIGTGTNHSVVDIANYISRDNSVTFLPERLGEAVETLADNRKSYTQLNWSPTVKINEWLSNESSRT